MSNPTEPKRVLFVDDEKLIADTFAIIFSREGYEARAAYSAEQALELISHWLPDLAIIDVHLPGINGLDLAIRMKAEYPDCKLLLVSGQPSTDEMLELARKNGHSFDILAKPTSPSELLAEASHLLYSTLATGHDGETKPE
jgi:DNA-binding response OmpR family regulator